MLVTVVKAELAPLYFSVKDLYLNPAGTSQTIQAMVFSEGQKLRTLETATRGLTAVVGEMVLEAIADAVIDGRTGADMLMEIVMETEGVTAGEVMAAVMVRVPD